MKSNHYTIIISPSDLRPAKKITLHRSTILLAAFTIVLLIFCGISGSYKYAEHNDLQARLEQATRDIAQLKEANLILMRSKEKERKVREFLGLDQSTKIPGEPGQGGPGDISEEMHEELEKSLPEPLDELSFSSSPPVSGRGTVVDEALSVAEDYEQLLDYLKERNKDLAVIPTISPVADPDAWIASSYGYRKSPFTGAREFHSGLDISAPRGTPILATGDGKVVFAGRNGALGKSVKIRHNSEYVTLYGHMLEIKVKKHQKVKRGDVIGYVGNTGRSTGYHVHYEVRKGDKSENPFNYVLNWKDRYLFAAHTAGSADH